MMRATPPRDPQMAHKSAPTSGWLDDAAAAPMRLTILGATGSIGTSTLDLVGRYPDRFSLEAVTAHGNAAGLAQLAIAHRAKLAVVSDPKHYQTLKQALSGSGIAAAAGPEALIEAARRPADCVLGAIVGAAGLEPTLAAVGQGRRVALANKECLVSAGHLFMAAVRHHKTELLPVDSEHAGVLQALIGQDRTGIARIVITASGGPFRTWTAAQIASATVEQALKHPKWSMGRKISIDSATLMNKGLELIEAHHLFDMAADQLGVVVHPQSIVHAMVEYIDGSVVAQLANPDMRSPIALALAWPRRMPSPTPPLDLAKLGTLTFEAPDEVRFPALRVAWAALRRGGGATAVLNAANESAVEAFLAGRIGIPQIAQVVEQTINHLDAKSGGLNAPGTLADVLAMDGEARRVAGLEIAAASV
jgi:1-deoxy-D-xylulose-5-phosphate reductoisomerase